MKIYEHNSVTLAIDFVEELRERLPVAIQRIKTDHNAEFGTDFTWHLHDLGIAHRHIPRGSPEPGWIGENRLIFQFTTKVSEVCGEGPYPQSRSYATPDRRPRAVMTPHILP